MKCRAEEVGLRVKTSKTKYLLAGRTINGRHAYYRLHKILWSGLNCPRTKCIVYKMLKRTLVLYGHEMWT